MYVVVFDVDGTLTPIKSSWQFIHIILNTIYRTKSLAELFLDGIISYDEWVAFELSVWKGLQSDVIKKILKAIPWRSGIEEIADLVKKYRSRAIFIAVSGGFDYMCERVVDELGFNSYLCARFQLCKDRLTGFADAYPDYRNKGEMLMDFLGSVDMDVDRIVCIGDNINDIGLFEVCDIAVAFCAHKVLRKYADIVIDTCNVRLLAKLLDKLLSSAS